MSAPVLVVGGAGFIGCNLAAHLAKSGQTVAVEAGAAFELLRTRPAGFVKAVVTP